ncbi:hypothetical protein AGMMS49957_08270 [Synergistales bacterium]|nr:hypothetical protein AGMMS49957_08270 [Synergistales bacterium]
MRLRAVILAGLIMAALTASLVLASLSHRFLPAAPTRNVRTLPWALYRMKDGRSGTVALPHTFRKLAPRTKVELWMNFESRPGDNLLIKTFYSPLRIYADGDLLFERGEEGSYPAFLSDPPTELTMVPLPKKTSQLRLEYLSPTQRDRLEAQPIFIGNDLSLYSRQFRADFITFAFSLLLSFFGLVVVLLALFLMRGLKEARSILWLGLLCLSSAAWGIGECDFTLFLIPYPTLLYLMAFCGLYFLPVPLIMYVTSMVRPVIKWPLHVTLAVDAVCLIVVLALQAAGKADLSAFLTQFHYLILFSFMASLVVMLLEHKRYKTRYAARFAASTLILIVFTLLEIFNYRMRLVKLLGLLFNTGLLLFLFDLGLISGRWIKEYIATAREKDRLETEMGFMSMILDARREQYARLMESSRHTVAARHDLRHQLAVVRGYSDAGDWRGLNAFLDKITENIKPAPSPLCENFAVSAVAGHYLSAARENGVSLEVRLDVPQSAGRVNDLDLCVIVGNLLENAVEACLRAGCVAPDTIAGASPPTESPVFVRFLGRAQNDALTLVVENSFDGLWQKSGDSYLSMKRRGVSGSEANAQTPQLGVGILSVREICRKYDGLLKFDIEGNVWCASVVLDLTGHLSAS